MLNTTKIKLIFLICGLLITTLFGQAQISPGDLSTAHADLEGISNCKKCHELGKKVSSQKCLDCHTEIKELISITKGYHGSKKISSQNCFDCHNEHHGRNFKITVFDKELFEHAETSYPLEGKHHDLSCTKCHLPANIAVKTTKKTRGDSYLGLQQDCLSCHEDYHQQSLGATCTQCHTLQGFKPATGFKHEQSKFPLLGKHKKVDCIKCHLKDQKNGKTFQQFKGIQYQRCINCHEDKHKGRFGSDCLKCHTENSFTSVKNLTNFNHEQTNFPLRGEHVRIDCKKCHKASLTKKLKHDKCTDCHADYHKTEFMTNQNVTDCKKCHSLEGFKPSSFTLEKHNQSEFQLLGAHIATPCISCHKKNIDWKFRKIGKKCIDCHADNHEGRISEKFMPEQNCASCHNPSDWPEISFDHKRTEFTLTGKHAIQTCRACHYTAGSSEKPVQRFKSLSSDCLKCHEDPHNSQFNNREDLSCKSCHKTEDWKPVLFNHDKTRFPLDGKHRDVDCIKCHKPMPGIKPYFQYIIKNTTCASCHS